LHAVNKNRITTNASRSFKAAHRRDGDNLFNRLFIVERIAVNRIFAITFNADAADNFTVFVNGNPPGSPEIPSGIPGVLMSEQRSDEKCTP
jgi:hypothetical protein